MLVIRPSNRRWVELKWNHMIRPEVIRRADRAPVNGQGLGLTIWYVWVWCVIKCYHVSIGLPVK